MFGEDWVRHGTGKTPGWGSAAAAALIGLLAVGVALTVALVVVPLAVSGQSGPLRDQGQLEPGRPADPTPTASQFQASGLAPGASLDPAIPPARAAGSQSLRPGQAAGTDPSRRPRPDSAPVVLLPTVAPEPTVEPAAPPRAEPRAESTRTRPAPPAAPARSWPVAAGTYQISQPFGCVPQLLGYYPIVPGCPAGAPAYHTGLDFAAEQGTPIYAAASGLVTIAGHDHAQTNTQIVIQHDGANEGYVTEYYHWIRTYVKPGDYVEAGDLIAEVGSVGYSTGPHLHFTVVDRATGQQLDPATWLPGSASTLAATNPANPKPEPASATGSTWERDASGGIVIVDHIQLDPTPASSVPDP